MARSDPQFNLRVPSELKQKVEDAAKESGRSINAEAVYRLEKSFEPEIKITETFEFESIQRAYLDQAKEMKLLREMIEQLLKKPS